MATKRNPSLKPGDWRVKMKIWQRHARGDSIAAIQTYLELHAGEEDFPRHAPERATIKAICDDWDELPEDKWPLLPPELQKVKGHRLAHANLKTVLAARRPKPQAVSLTDDVRQALMAFQSAHPEYTISPNPKCPVCGKMSHCPDHHHAHANWILARG